MKKARYYRGEGLSFKNLNDNSIIGVELNSGERGFVKKINPESYVVVKIDINMGYHRLMSEPSIDSLLNRILGKKDVVVFDNKKQLGEWLIGIR